MMLSITLASGRIVFGKKLFIGNTYESLLEGIPNESMIPGEINQIRRAAARSFATSVPSYLLGTPLRVGKHGERRLPNVFVCADCWSPQPAREMTKHASALTVIWFQDEFPPVISDVNATAFRDMPWDREAQDFEW